MAARRKMPMTGPFWTGGGARLREPTVRRGADKPIPEKRPEILEKIVSKLDSTGAFLQQYSNGEFTSSSLAVARTEADLKGVRVLEAPGYEYHYDPETKIFWRHGGSFD